MSPYWDKEFEDAVSDGAIEKPPQHVSLGGSWSSITDTGEATNLNLVRMLPVATFLYALLFKFQLMSNGVGLNVMLTFATGAYARFRPTECERLDEGKYGRPPSHR
jgi:hypothetical protein